MKPVGAALMALQLAVTLAACGSNHAEAPADAAVDAAPAEDGPPDDAGAWLPVGARVVSMNLARPFLPGSCELGCPSRIDTKLVLRASATADGIDLRAGVVAAVTDGGVGTTFTDRLTPTPAPAQVGAAYEADAGPRRPFATVATLEWGFDIVPAQPPLPIRKATFSGSLDPTGVPTSDDPGAGKTVGCFTAADAAQVYIVLLSETLEELLESSGVQLDVDCTDSGSLDGYSFELDFAAEPLTLDE